MSRALEVHVGEVVYLGPDESFGTRFIERNSARLNRIWMVLTGKILLGDKHRLLAHRLARVFERRIQDSPCDILFAPIAASEIAFLKTKIPIIYCSDITWPLILDYYPDLEAVSSSARAEGQYIESLAVRRASACVFPSNWAARSCCDDFGVPSESVHQISFGANLNDPPARSAALKRSLGGTVNLILVGVDWERKGGPIAFECLTTLLKNNIDATLTLCGCIPPAGFEHPQFRVIPFLSKHDPEQWEQMAQLYLNAHFMLFPTRAEAFGVVTCEASAFGLPTIATDTGGVCGALIDGVNGYALPYNAGGDAYAAKIMQIIAEPNRYDTLVVSCRDEYERRLNWDAWGRSMRSVVNGILKRI